MRARTSARLATLLAPALAFAATAGACRLTSGLTGGAVDDAGREGASTDCDADITRSVENCGACGHACAYGPNSFAGCADGGCFLACAPGFGDCDDAAANGCEVNVNATRTSCGRCGHDCQGGQCAGGACQPLSLAGTVNAPVHIAIDDTYVYGINAYGTVTRVPKNGGAIVELAPGSAMTPQSPPPRIAMANNALYYTSFNYGGAGTGDAGTVSVYSLDAGKAVVMAQGGQPLAIAADTTHVYWSEGDPSVPAPSGMIKRCKVGSCGSSVETVSPLESGRIFSIELDGPNVFWTNAGTLPTMPESAVKTCPQTAPCTPRALVNNLNGNPLGPFDVQVDRLPTPTTFWTTTSGAILTCLVAGCSEKATTLDAFQYGPRFLAAQGGTLFWTNGDGTIKSLPKVGPSSSERILYQVRGASPWDIAVDNVAIYWTDPSVTSLFKLAR